MNRVNGVRCGDEVCVVWFLKDALWGESPDATRKSDSHQTSHQCQQHLDCRTVRYGLILPRKSEN